MRIRVESKSLSQGKVTGDRIIIGWDKDKGGMGGFETYFLSNPS